MLVGTGGGGGRSGSGVGLTCAAVKEPLFKLDISLAGGGGGGGNESLALLPDRIPLLTGVILKALFVDIPPRVGVELIGGGGSGGGFDGRRCGVPPLLRTESDGLSGACFSGILPPPEELKEFSAAAAAAAAAIAE